MENVGVDAGQLVRSKKRKSGGHGDRDATREEKVLRDEKRFEVGLLGGANKHAGFTRGKSEQRGIHRTAL